jgi:S1/P1 Nuclease
MKPLLTHLLALSSFLLPCSRAFAWSGAGHQVIAAEAYRQLSPTLKTKVTEILKSHPDYEKWEKSFVSESPNLDLPAFIFMRSSTWPDEIRRKGNHYDHPKWHYVDYPLKPPKS